MFDSKHRKLLFDHLRRLRLPLNLILALESFYNNIDVKFIIDGYLTRQIKINNDVYKEVVMVLYLQFYIMKLQQDIQKIIKKIGIQYLLQIFRCAQFFLMIQQNQQIPKKMPRNFQKLQPQIYLSKTQHKCKEMQLFSLKKRERNQNQLKHQQNSNHIETLITYLGYQQQQVKLQKGLQRKSLYLQEIILKTTALLSKYGIQLQLVIRNFVELSFYSKQNYEAIQHLEWQCQELKEGLEKLIDHKDIIQISFQSFLIFLQ